MYIVWQVVFLLLWLFRMLVLARIVVEVVRAFARRWHPQGVAVIAVELIYTTTDPPVKAMRRAIPSVRFGGVSFDLSILVLLILLLILLNIVGRLMHTAGAA